MNFINWLSSGASLLNFHLSSQGATQNTLLRSHISTPASTGFVECSRESTINEGGRQVEIMKDIGKGKRTQGSMVAMTQGGENLDRQSKQLQSKLLLEQDKLLNECLTVLTCNLQQRLEAENHKNQKAQTTKNKVHRKKIFRSKTNNICGHTELPHYAKGMCDNCYHKNGRTKKPWKCDHTKLYACGLCQNCYANEYNKNKRLKGNKPQLQMDDPAIQQ